MNKRVARCLATLFLGLVNAAAFAVPIPGFNLGEFIERSDIIVIGKLSQVRQVEASVEEIAGTKRQVSQYQAVIFVEAWYKGEWSSVKPLLVRYALPADPFFLGYALPETDVSRMYFLSTKGGHLRFFSPYYPCLPVLSRRPRLEDKMNFRAAIEAELLQNILNGDEDLAISSLARIAEGDWSSDALLAVCKTNLVNAQSIRLRAAALRYRLRNHDSDAGAAAVKLISEANLRRDDYVIQYVAADIPSVASTLTKQQLEALLNISFPAIDLAVAEVARKRGTKDFAPLAVRILASSKSKDAVYQAIVFLSSLWGAGPGWDEFMADRDKVVKDFLRWWTDEGKEKFSIGGDSSLTGVNSGQWTKP
jgi:hypothetical protein